MGHASHLVPAPYPQVVGVHANASLTTIAIIHLEAAAHLTNTALLQEQLQVAPAIMERAAAIQLAHAV